MSDALGALAWPASRSAEALQVLARMARLDLRAAEAPAEPAWLDTCGPNTLHDWLVSSAEWFGIDVERLGAHYDEFEQLLLSAGPALLKLPGPQVRLLALVGRKGRQLRLLALDRSIHLRSLEEVRSLVCGDIEQMPAERVERILAQDPIPEDRREQVRQQLRMELLRSFRVERCWLLRSPASAPLARQARQAGLYRYLGALLCLYAAQGALAVASWWFLGNILGQSDGGTGWLFAWALALGSMVPLRLLSVWCSGTLTLLAGSLMRRHLLAGAMNMAPEDVRRQGVGHLMGITFETENLEVFLLNGTIQASSALLELLVAAVLLTAGAGGPLQSGFLFLAICVAAVLGFRFYRVRTRWTRERLSLTHGLIERMLGHRTRLIQEHREKWHQGEDQLLSRYVGASAAQERSEVRLTSLLPPVWLCLSIAGLTGPFISSAAPLELATGLGGLLLAYPALRKLTFAMLDLSTAASSWREVHHVLAANRRLATGAAPQHVVAPVAEESSSRTLIDASHLLYRYEGREHSVLHDVSLKLQTGDRVLLEGASGGGKSTLASLLAGLRHQTTGLLLVEGRDWKTLGARGWRARVVAAPQFHENHVFTGTLAFNLLMGGEWPAHPEDLKRAEALCRELGLGDLLERMPGGLHQIVGETGWQLSHGERSRVFIARALLQRAALVILDESFAALDPTTLEQVMECVRRHARALLVVAHP
ncbi:ATP-binding cassette domain-containing protein [Corallococcus exercitus]|uniref:ATP-binding cassette domain-containing protein n=1 Tax=Corallococcus exercitus TaxID=2316736 RepID=UPI000EA1657A|nr:ATP-binding cassette domain-containing protein [Corallococcus exercitus]RKG82049.1 ATP-binding cassette domain-containing protein [Corallococcus exercitus]